MDATTQGSWVGAYGSDGQVVSGQAAAVPSYAQVSFAGGPERTWAISTNDSRAPVVRGGAAAGAWAAESFDVDVNVGEGTTRRVSLYAIDWDNTGRAQKVEALDADTNQVLETQTISNFAGGKYLSFDVTGHVKFRLTATAGRNAALSGVFFDTVAAPTAPATVAHAGEDSTTRGNWVGTYGGDGRVVAGSVASAPIPSYAEVSFVGKIARTWTAATSDPRALVAPGGYAAATAWYGQSFVVDVNVGTGTTRRVSLYALDWNNQGRSEKIEVLDAASGQVLDTRTIQNFSSGRYVSFDVTGHVKFRITSLSGPNAVLSGVFFDTPNTGTGAPTSPPASPPVVSVPPVSPPPGPFVPGKGPAGAPAAVPGQVVVTPDWIVTPYDAIPNFGGHPTIVAVHSGNWSDPATWGGRVPVAGEVVSISNGMTVTYDQVSDVKLDTVAIQAGGTLQFRTDVNTRLRVTNLLVMEGGTLTIGTAADPVRANVKAQVTINDLPIDLSKDPSQYGHGLIALGKVTMRGATLSDSAVRLAVEPKAGDTTLTLAVPALGWKAGDRLVLPDTRQLDSTMRSNYQSQDELIFIAAVSADGKTITLTAPLAYDHLGARDADGKLTFLPQVGDLTRNVVINSENARGNRGYTLFTMRADVDIQYAQFSGLGRSKIDPWNNTVYDSSGNVAQTGTNQQGRYPITFDHLIGPAQPPANGYQFTFNGNSVFCPVTPMPFRWGIALNASSYGSIQDNVLYNWAGAGIVGETGAEVQNVIAGNFITTISGVSASSRADDRGFNDIGHEGAGIWFRGPDNYVRDNSVAHANYGYDYWMFEATAVKVPTGPGADPSTGQYKVVDMTSKPLLEFAGNESYGATRIGLSIWSLGTNYTAVRADAQPSVVKDFHVWNVYEEGYYGYETNRLTFDGLVFRGDWSALAKRGEGPIAMFASDYLQKDFTIQNSDIQGARVGWMPTTRSIGAQTIQNTYMRNYYNITMGHMWLAGATAEGVAPRKVVVRNVQFAQLPIGDPMGPQQNIVMSDSLGDPINVVQLDQLFVYNYNNQQGNNFQVFYKGQAANAIVPQSTYNTDGTTKITGAPVAGLTNAQTWAKYGIAVGGAMAPANATTKNLIDGLVAPI